MSRELEARTTISFSLFNLLFLLRPGMRILQLRDQLASGGQSRIVRMYVHLSLSLNASSSLSSLPHDIDLFIYALEHSNHPVSCLTLCDFVNP